MENSKTIFKKISLVLQNVIFFKNNNNTDVITINKRRKYKSNKY